MLAHISLCSQLLQGKTAQLTGIMEESWPWHAGQEAESMEGGARKRDTPFQATPVMIYFFWSGPNS